MDPAQLAQVLNTTMASNRTEMETLLQSLNLSRSSTVREVTLPTLSTVDTLTFETWKGRVAETILNNGWADDDDKKKRAVRALKASLDGEMGQAASHLTTDNFNDPTAFLDALSALIITPAGAQMARAEFSESFQGAGETILSFSTRLRHQFRRAYPNGDVVRDERLKTRFLKGLSDSSRGCYPFSPAPHARGVEN